MVARIVVRIYVLLAVVFFGLLTVPSHRPVPAGAAVPPQAPPPPPCGERAPVALNPPVGPAGTVVTATGCGWAPGSQITVSWDNPPTTLTTATADSGGGFTVSFTVPATTPPGDHQILFTQSCGGCVPRLETALFTVTAGPVPATPTPTPTPTPPPGPPPPPPPPPCDPSVAVTLSPSFGPEGTLVTAQGCGWTPGAWISVWWENEEQVAISMVDQSDHFSVTFSVPDDDEGRHPVSVFQAPVCPPTCTWRLATATFTVTEG
jgi:hypothetical protein